MPDKGQESAESRPTDGPAEPTAGRSEGKLVHWDGISPGGVMIGGQFHIPPGCTPEEEAAISAAEYHE